MTFFASSRYRFTQGVTKGKIFRLSPEQIFLLLLALALLILIPFIFAADSNGFQYTSWRQTDTASIAHNLVYNRLNLFYPQIHWRGSGTGYVETEFQLYPFLTAVLYKLFGEQIELGLLLSFAFSVGTLVLFYALARRLLDPATARRPARILPAGG
ncbi:MAG: hypothetical protein HZC41_13090 [Chloroflexi bacterium]|nr:hypothetical protein [Chloroflexota bacterium]